MKKEASSVSFIKRKIDKNWQHREVDLDKHLGAYFVNNSFILDVGLKLIITLVIVILT